MKNIFKFLSIGVVAVTTFFASGCGCGCALKGDKLVVRVNSLENSSIAKVGNENKPFKADLKIGDFKEKNNEYYNEYYSYVLNVENGLELIETKYTGEDKVETGSLKKTYGESDLNEALLVQKYDELKKMPKALVIASSKEANDPTIPNDLRKLIGIDDQHDMALSKFKFSIESKKSVIGGDVTYNMQYDIQALPKAYVKAQIKVNKNDKITYAKLETLAPSVDIEQNEKLSVKLVLELSINY